MSIELKITDRTNVEFHIVIKDNKGNEIYKQWKDGNWSERTYDDNGNEIYRQVESGFWWEWTYDDNNNCLTCKDSNGFHYIKGKEVTKREYEAFINNKEKMSNKQSSIEWLIDQLEKWELYSKISFQCLKEIEQAKEMHKQEIMNACDRFANSIDFTIEDFEQYYKETYGGNNEQQ